MQSNKARDHLEEEKTGVKTGEPRVNVNVIGPKYQNQLDCDRTKSFKKIIGQERSPRKIHPPIVGLDRSKTSVGVYSNLAAYNNPVKGIISLEPENGNEAKNCKTALHSAAKLGKAATVFRLLKNGENVNQKNQENGRTALFEAVLGRRRDVCEVLLCLGADTACVDKNNQTVWQTCPKTFFADVCEVLDAISDKRLDVQELSQGVTSFFNKASFSVAVQTTTLMSPIVTICRRQTLEENRLSFSVAETEDIFCDVITLQMLEEDSKIEATITFIFHKILVSSKEEIVILQGNVQRILPKSTDSQKNCLTVTFDTELLGTTNFLPVIRPRIEYFPVERAQNVLIITADEMVRMTIAKNTFDSKSTVSIQSLEMPEHAEVKDDEVLASTPFYKIELNKTPTTPVEIELPSPDLFKEDGKTIVLTKTANLWREAHSVTDNKRNTLRFATENFPMYAVAVMVKPHYLLQKLTKDIALSFGLVFKPTYRVNFLCMTRRFQQTSTFSVVLECCDIKDLGARLKFWTTLGYNNSQQKKIMDEVNVESKSSLKVVFLDNAITRENPREYVIEFHRKRINYIQFPVELRGNSVQFIKGQIFIYPFTERKFDDKTDIPLDVKDVNIVLNKNEIGKENDNQKEHTAVGKSDKYNRVSSAIYKSNRAPEIKTDALKNIRDSLAKALKNIDPVEFSTAEIVTHTDTPTHRKEITELETDDTVFLNDTMIETLINEFENDWYKIFMLMGIQFCDIESQLLHNPDTNKLKTMLFRKWRDDQRSRDDNGVPLINAALFKSGNRNLGTKLQVAVRNWYGKWKTKEGAFQEWVSKAYKDANLFVPSDYPKPMSDAYLVLMADELPVTRDFTAAFLLSEQDIDDILNNPQYLANGIRAMKMLTLYREKTASTIESLENLIHLLEELGFDKLRNYAIKCAQAWVKRTATRKDDPFRYQVGILTRKLEEI